MQRGHFSMKRWFAALLAGIMLFGWGTACAEQRPQTNADIVAQMATQENSEEKTGLTDMFTTLIEVVTSEEFRSLLEFDDVKEVINDVLAVTLSWLYENRPVTMKIFRELGVEDQELSIIDRLWDSMDRILSALDDYLTSEEGKALEASWTELQSDKSFKKFVTDFVSLVNKEDIQALIRTLIQAIRTEGEILSELEADKEKEETAFSSSMILKAREKLRAKGLTKETSISGSLLRILEHVMNSEWAKDAMPELIEKECLWNFIEQISGIADSELAKTIRAELSALGEDPEMQQYMADNINAIVQAVRKWSQAQTEQENQPQEQ